MGDILIFNNPQFGDIRTAGTAEKPLFCAVDVARALGYARPADAVTDHCKGVVILPTPTKGGTQQVKFIKEPDVYRLVFKSNAPNAEIFNSWLAEEVLPSIRKHGAYATPATIESIIADPDSGIKLLQALKEEQEKRKLAEYRRELAQRYIEEQQPKVVFADAIVGSQSSCLIGELAKILAQNGVKNMGQNRLFEWLRQNHYLGTSGEYRNIPNQRYIEQGLFELKKSTHSENGVMKTTVTPKVLPKGQLYFMNMFLKNKESGLWG